MTDFEIIEARAHHCGQICRLLRSEHESAILRIGMSAHHRLRAVFDESGFRKAWMVDGALAGLGGVTGPLVASSGMVWFALSRRALHFRMRLVKEAQNQLAILSAFKHELVTEVYGGDEPALRFAIFLGFTPVEQCARAVSADGRRDLARFLDAPEQRVVYGNGYVIPLRYRPDRG